MANCLPNPKHPIAYLSPDGWRFCRSQVLLGSPYYLDRIMIEACLLMIQTWNCKRIRKDGTDDIEDARLLWKAENEAWDPLKRREFKIREMLQVKDLSVLIQYFPGTSQMKDTAVAWPSEIVHSKCARLVLTIKCLWCAAGQIFHGILRGCGASLGSSSNEWNPRSVPVKAHGPRFCFGNQRSKFGATRGRAFMSFSPQSKVWSESSDSSIKHCDVWRRSLVIQEALLASMSFEVENRITNHSNASWHPTQDSIFSSNGNSSSWNHKCKQNNWWMVLQGALGSYIDRKVKMSSFHCMQNFTQWLSHLPWMQKWNQERVK